MVFFGIIILLFVLSLLIGLLGLMLNKDILFILKFLILVWIIFEC